MSDKSINFHEKKIRRSNFFKNKKVFQIDDVDVNETLVFKKNNHMAQKIGLNALLDIIIMMLLDHYV